MVRALPPEGCGCGCCGNATSESELLRITMATSVSLAISRELTGFGLKQSQHRKGAGREPSPSRAWMGATALNPQGQAHIGVPPLTLRTQAPPDLMEPQHWCTQM